MFLKPKCHTARGEQEQPGSVCTCIQDLASRGYHWCPSCPPLWLVHSWVLEKEMATHSSSLAWEIPWTEEPDRVQSMGSQKSQTGLRD